MPNRDYFPGTDLKGHEKAKFIFENVQRNAGMLDWPVELVELDVLPAAISDNAFIVHGEAPCAGTFQFEDDHGLITYDPSLLKRPIALIATFAHELGHYLNGSFPEPPPDGWELVEPATDVTATFLGFGLFGANESCADYEEYSVDGIPQARRGKAGYLTEAQWVFDLAIFCHLTHQNIDVLQSYMKSHLWKQFQRAYKSVGQRDIPDMIKSSV